MKKIMLINGCSHTSGSEIDGTEDSVFNRQHSFGNLLAYKMGYEPINIAENGSTNPTILRTTLEWINSEYDPSVMELFVLIGWAESSRMELPRQVKADYNPTCSGWMSKNRSNYMYLNQGYAGGNEEERKMMPYYQKFIVNHLLYLEILSANMVLHLQSFLKFKKIDYLMCNTMHMYDTKYEHLNFYIDQVDHTKYKDLTVTPESFFWKYKLAGYENPKAKYWHHSEEPHRLFSEDLYKFVEDNYVYN